MSKNWMRHFELQILSEKGEGISLSDFKVTFTIEWTDTKWPRVANVKVYNLSKDTSSRILGQEYAKIRIIAGYDGMPAVVDESQVGIAREINESQVGQTDGQNFGVIFDGEIRFTVTGRDNPTDTWVLIQAIDSHQAFNNASVITTLAAGYTVADVHAAVLDSCKPFGITQGITGDFPTTVFPRGKTFYQSSRDVMDFVAAQCGASWQFVAGQLNLIPTNKYIHDAIRLNSDTGLIGMPQQTMGGGVNVRCLINPNIQISGLVQIDQASVYRASLSADEIKALPGRVRESGTDGNLYVDGVREQPSAVATDGIYVVRAITYTGDTRGQPWYMDLMCFARGDATKMNPSAQQRAL